MNVDPRTRTGRVLDKYELLEKVGEGGMAEVYRARHQALGREVAVKLLHPHLSATERNRMRFEREARAIETLQHPHILRIFDYSGRDSDICYIVTEFIHGRTLKDLLTEQSAIPSEVAANIGIALCEALTYAHEHGVIHRDIKPENVMIRQDGVVKLMDFGIARVIDESTMTLTGGLVGSPAYMSPEQASDQDVDARTDLFSLGTLLFRSVTGSLPFQGGSTPVILHRILEGTFEDPLDLVPGMSARLASVIRQALSPKPDDRFGTAREMELALREVLSEAHCEAGKDEVQRYVAEPTQYTEWLHQHLKTSLVATAREHMAADNTAGAMKLLNRALSLDDQNPELQVLIQSLHTASAPRFPRRLVAGLGLLTLPIVVALGVGLVERLSSEALPLVEARSIAPVSASTLQPGGSIPALTDVDAGLNDNPALEPSPTPAPAPSAEPPAPVQAILPAPVASTAPVMTTPAASPSPSAGKLPRTPFRSTSNAPLTGAGPTQSPLDGQGRRPSRNSSKAAIAGAPDPVVMVTITADQYADVFIDDHPYGDTRSRRTAIMLPPGDHRLKLSNPMCEPLDQLITVLPGKPFQRHYHLELKPAQIELRNFPAGTLMYLDGNPVGSAPLSQPLPITPRVPHEVRALYPGEQDAVTFSIPPQDSLHRFAVDGRRLSDGPR